MKNPDNNAKNGDLSNHVQERLLLTAEKLFAEKGFDGTSIRDLTAEANCNVAAVNYHFGGKENLYTEVFSRRLTGMRDVRIKSIERVMNEENCDATLENLIRAFANAFIEPFLDQSVGRHFIKLMTREMIEHRLPPNMFFEQMFLPVQAALHQAINKLCPTLNGEKIHMCIHSIIAQLIHVIRVKEFFDRSEDLDLHPIDLPKTIDHIVDFSVAGLRFIAEEKVQ